MQSGVNERVERYRSKLRSAGLRPVQLWVPDTRSPGFSEECRRQSQQIAIAEQQDQALNDFLDEALDDILD